MSDVVQILGPGVQRRVSVPPCSRLGAPTGAAVECPTCTGRVQLKTFGCTKHGAVTTEKPAPGVRCCADCPDRDPPLPRAIVPALQVHTKSAGIGDHLLTLAVAEGLRRDHGCPVVVASHHAAWLSLFWPWVVTQPHKLPTCFCDNNPVQDWRGKGIPRHQHWADLAGVRPVLPEPLPLPDAAKEWAVPYAGAVVLAPFAAYAERTWGLWHWLELESQLVRKGFPTVILDTVRERVAPFKGHKLVNEAPARVAAVVSTAACTVANDSGIAHLAGFLRAPAVGIVHAASDKGILDLYPTVRSLHADTLTPLAVAQAAVTQVRSGLDPEFPAAAFLATLAPLDGWRGESWLPVYSALWRVVRGLNPRTVVEIGTRAGQSAWTMLDACPDAEVTGYDVEELVTPYGGGFAGANAHARRLLAGKRFKVIPADSTKLDRLPPCDLAFIDGDHPEPIAYADICLAERSGAKVILVDDYTAHPSVALACKRFLAEHPHRRGRFIPSMTGLYLIEGEPCNT